MSGLIVNLANRFEAASRSFPGVTKYLKDSERRDFVIEGRSGGSRGNSSSVVAASGTSSEDIDCKSNGASKR
jgi:hypothetical protein